MATFSNDFGWLWLFKNGLSIPDIAYDGIVPEGANIQDKEYKLCLEDNVNAAFVFLDAGNDFQDFSTEMTPFNCSLN